MFTENNSVFSNHPVLGLVVGSLVLIGSTIAAGFAGSWIADGAVGLVFKK